MTHKKAGVIILAGGEGSRLGWKGPKGTFPVDGKSLFQIQVEKCKGVPVAIMTSPLNDETTKAFFQKHQLFGHTELSFFMQDELPLLDENGDAIPDLFGPDGNGKVLHHFVTSNLWEAWKKKGIDILSVIPIDNPKADPLDETFLSSLRGAEVAVKVIERKEGESIGAFIQKEGRYAVIEYSELPQGHFPHGYSGMMAFSIEFALKASKQKLPLHLARKTREGRKILKRETFLFDLLPFAEKVVPHYADRERCFDPIKVDTAALV